MKISDIAAQELKQLDEANRKALSETPFGDLIQFHHTLGRYLRNTHSLWANAWEPSIENGCDVSDDHPDAVSMRIIEEMWRRAQP